MNNANNTMPTRVIALIVGLVLNALGSGLTVATNMGAAPWTAAEVNLAYVCHISIGLMIFLVGVLVTITNQLLIKRWDKYRFFGEIIFIASFSYFTDVFINLFDWLKVPQLMVLWRILFCMLGIIIFCVAISLYQRANLVMHPNDDTTNILRFDYCKGRVVIAQLINFVVPIIAIIVSGLLMHHIYSVNIGTLLCIGFNGPIIGLADQHVWHGLNHNF